MMAIYLLSTSLKGVSSYKLAIDIGMHQSNAWLMAHRIRTIWANNASQIFGCEVEVDETDLSGKENNKHQRKKLNAGRGVVGKTAVVGIKERGSRQIKSFKVANTKALRAQPPIRTMLSHMKDFKSVDTIIRQSGTRLVNRSMLRRIQWHSLKDKVAFT